MLAQLQLVVLLVLYLVVFLMCVYALVDAARRPPRAFVDAGKRTKGFWAAVLGAASAIAFVALPWPIGLGGMSMIFVLLCAVAAGVYLADVKPAVGPYSGGTRRGGGARGGW